MAIYPMNSADTISLINRIEVALPVSEWRAHGVQLWPIIRSRLFFSVFDETAGAGWERGGSVRRVGRRARAALRSVGSAMRNALDGVSPRSQADIVIVTDGVATARINGLAYDIVADPIGELATESGLSFRTWYTTYACPEPRHTEGALVQWRLDAAQVIRGLLGRSGNGSKATSLDGFDEFLSLVRSAGLPEDAVSAERMVRLAERVAAMAERFSVWLCAAAPRMVFVNCYYSLEGAALVLACSRHKITSVDIQHGVQGALHVAYGAWAKVPTEGYELLPDRFWCWSETEVNAIESWTRKQTDRHIAMVGGNPWLDMWRDERVPLVADADKAVRLLVQSGRRTVLVTLQWGMTDDLFLEPLIDLIVSATSWTWWVRLHPIMRSRCSEIQASFRRRGLNEVFIDDSSMFALPALLRQADVHLTHSSSVVLEASSFGVASLVTSPTGAASFPELAQNGRVRWLQSLEASIALPALDAMASRKQARSEQSPGLGLRAMRELLDSKRHSEKSALGDLT